MATLNRAALDDRRWYERLEREVGDRTRDVHVIVAAHAAAGDDEARALTMMSRERISRTVAHSERVARYAVSVARDLGVCGPRMDHIEQAARFHDIGKLTIPVALLQKPSGLTPGEFAIMRRHAQIGSEILTATRTLTRLAPLVLASHEWFDGGGYPRGIAGIRIPLGSRIIAVVDAYDAMTQDSRSYRTPVSASTAVAELLARADTQFDPAVVQAFVAILARH